MVLAKSKALKDIESSVEKARICVLKTSILVAWAVVGGKKIQHFCVLLGTGEKSLQCNLILSLINLSHFSLFFSFIMRVKVCHCIYICVCLFNVSIPIWAVNSMGAQTM